ncbi:MAG: hypothetical protein ABWY64_21875 [Tardiphaga sp.]
MAIKLPPLPAPNQRLIGADGMIDPVWYQWLKGLEKRLREAGIADLGGGLGELDLTALRTGDTLRWDAAEQRWRAGI